MRSLLRVGVVALVALVCQAAGTRAQVTGPPSVQIPGDPWRPAGSASDPSAVAAPAVGSQFPVPAPPPVAAGDIAKQEKNLELMRAQLQAVQAGGAAGDNLQKRVDLLEKQIELQQKMIKLLLEQIKPPAGGETVEQLQTKIATLEARSKQAAQRDQEVAHAIDILNDHMDAEERNGPRLPMTLKEMFLPSRPNETPVSIYGQFLENYQQFNGKPGRFSTPDFAPYFLVQLKDQFLLEANIDISNAGVSVSEAQVDWIVTDWLTVVVGRYITPIGYFNERLNHEWINRLPDVPLMFRQVSPLIDNDGIQLRGAAYLGCLPIKLEYSLYGGNGLQLAAAPGGINDVANLELITGGPDEIDARALGGRLGFWVPQWGLTTGISGYFNGRYSPASADRFELVQYDFGLRKGNWDLRFEYAYTYQQAAATIGNNINRSGLYAQVAYRPNHLQNCILRNLEVVFRYSRVWFRGIDPKLLDPTTFDTLVDVPVNRDQYTFGLNYYFYPAMALRFAYEINHEFQGINYHDNVFLAQYVWSF
jgi:hypothetical protein